MQNLRLSPLPAPAVPQKLTKFVATLRCIINSPDEVEAQLTADRLQMECMELLDEDDGDEVRLTQVTSMSSELEPEELILTLQRSRNALIRTRIKECYDQASQLDQTIHRLKTFYDNEISEQYNYGAFFDLAEAILTRGEDPI